MVSNLQHRHEITNDQREITPKYVKQSHGSCIWHIVSLCSTTVWSFIQIAWIFFNLQNGHKIAFTNLPRGKYTSKSYGSYVWHVVSRCFISVWNFIQLARVLFNLQSGHEITLHIIKEITQKKCKAELWLLHMTHRLIVLYNFKKVSYK